MKRISQGLIRAIAAAVLALALVPDARCFLGVADTSFVTVIANPAEAANWASELEVLNNQVAAARSTLATVAEMRAFAGDPKAAVAAISDLSGISSQVGSLVSGAQTEADLLRTWQAMGSAERLQAASSLLASAGPGSTMRVFGQAQPRDATLYGRLAQEASDSAGIRSQIASEQTARTSVAASLAAAWVQFKAAATESDKQSILAEISQLESQNQVMDTRRRAVLDDLALSDRQNATEAGVRSKAADERLLAESALLNAGATGRVQASESQRTATLQKPLVTPIQPDYSGMKLWTTADAGSTAQ
jgi:hypothetical protein